MKHPRESYQTIARQCAYAHRMQDRASAGAFFAELWKRLDSECLKDHCDARAIFNDTFGYAYRTKWSPDDDTPALARAVGVNAVKSAVAPAPRKSVALDCAAFFARKVEA